MTQNVREMEILHGPYRATHLWNGIIYDFRTKMPLRKHRRQMRQFDNCFAACDAVEWLHRYLCHNPNFGPNVSRKQTIQLIGKLKQYHIIEDVRGCPQVQSEEFKDNRNLYRFAHQLSPVKRSHSCPNRTPLHSWVHAAARETNSNEGQKQLQPNNKADSQVVLLSTCQQEIPECQLVTRQLTISEIENTWKATTLGKLQAVLHVNSLEGYLDINNISPKFIIHNVNKINSNGIVMPINRTEELPHWLLNAMKCLVAWPKASGGGSCLPNYPGFEKDVFRVVRDYFQNLEEPLTTFGMYEILSAVYSKARAGFLENTPAAASLDNAENQEEVMPLTMTPSMENLVRRMAQAWKSGEPGDHLGPTLESSSSNCHSANAIHMERDNSKIVADVQSNTLLPKNACYETAFLTASPVTRVVSPSESNSKLGISPRPHSSMSSIEIPHDVCSRLTVHSPRCVSVANLHDGQKLFVASCSEKLQASIRGRINKRETFLESAESAQRPIPRCSVSQANICDSDPNQWLNRSGGYINLAYTDRSSEYLNSDLSSPGVPHEDLTSAKDILDFPLSKKEAGIASLSNTSLPGSCSNTNEDGSVYHTAHSISLQSNLNNDGDLKSVASHTSSCFTSTFHDSIKSPCRNSKQSNSLMTSDTKLRKDLQQQNPDQCHNDSSFMTMDDKMLAIDGLQLSLLCVSPDNRRKLHLLLRFMYRLANNNQLVLESNTSNRALVLDTFTRSVVRACQEVDYNEQLAVKLVAFLMDNHEIILAVPDTLKNQVEERLTLMCQSKIKYSMDDDACALTYCQQVTKEEYERQRVSLSERAIADLLNSIITDPRLSSREKQKKLKQFKKMYPDIYAEKFPPAKKTVPLFSKSLRKLKVLRM